VNVFRKPYPTPVALAPDLDSFKQQESTFIILNLFVLALLLLIHTLFASHWGHPSAALIAVLAAAFMAQAAELIWVLALKTPLGPGGIALLTWFSIAFNIVVALLLAEITNREDTQYFILMVVPVLVAAFRLALVPTLGVVALVDFINFFWVWSYARKGSPGMVGEYFEAGTVSLIYAIVGILTWLLVNNLHQKEERLSQSLSDLKSADEALVREAKLAAVGRLSSAIAHEIRNPVSAIVSALATADRADLTVPERAEMFEIAGKEAARLEKLTTDFLAYARPRELQRAPSPVEDTVGYVADVCRPRAAQKGVDLHADSLVKGSAEIDAGQVEQALVNLVMNAVEASRPGGRVALRVLGARNGMLRMDVEDAGESIPPEIVARVFEPFFTTKPAGTGLGLAIALGIARAHGGDLVLSSNVPGRVCFSMTISGAK
jgi:two-component system, NtrC family, sensor histidine kinase HydH